MRLLAEAEGRQCLIFTHLRQGCWLFGLVLVDDYVFFSNDFLRTLLLFLFFLKISLSDQIFKIPQLGKHDVAGFAGDENHEVLLDLLNFLDYKHLVRHCCRYGH